MGVDFNALLFYGMPIDGELGFDPIDTFQNPNGPLEVINLSPMTGSNYACPVRMLFVRESYRSGDKHSDEVLVKLSDVTGKQDEWRQLIVDACVANGLTFVEPGWYFATMFS